MKQIFTRNLCSIILCTLFSLSVSRDYISLGQPLADNETLVSSGGHFSLGFFSPVNSSYRYIGIWYNNIPVETVVWVGNRDNPVTNSAGQLSVTANFSVLITDETSTSVWSTAPNYKYTGKPLAQLLDTGNFILKQEGDTSNNYAWQGFDYPTDILLPGMKLGVDKTNGVNFELTSWNSIYDPSSGDYSLAMNIMGNPELYLYSKQYGKLWRSGPWDGLQFSGISKDASSYNFTGFISTFVNNDKEVSYSYSYESVYNFRVLVDGSGEIQWQVYNSMPNEWDTRWTARGSQCDRIANCGPNAICDSNRSPICGCLQGFVLKNLSARWDSTDSAYGCVRKTQLNCKDGTDGFLAFSGVKLPESSSNFFSSTMFNLDDCQHICMKNCSCTAYASGFNGSGCMMWLSDLSDIVQFDNVNQALYVRLAAADLYSAPNTHSQLKVVTIAVSLLTGMLLLSCLIFSLRRRKKWRRVLSRVANGYKLDKAGSGKEFDLPLFSFDDIATATGSFTNQNKLGQGGFGSVYKGMIGEGQEIAVKRLAKSSLQGTEEFKNEVVLIAKLQNRNLVRLLGCCIQGEERMLIYEYMPNRSLDAFLFVKEKAALLEWRTRYQIIVGITRGLLYLHHDSRFRVIHRDLKASNILLDKDMNPKISDFGMARLFAGDETDYNTRKVVGTYGYMSPEYAMEGIFSLKSDVFSYGVLLLEIISGKKNRGPYAFSQHLNLIAHAWSLWTEDKCLEVVDDSMGGNFPVDIVLKCIKIGLLCVQEHAEDRPLMSWVIEVLGADIVSLPQPKQPGFIARINPLEVDHFTNSQGSCNGLTETLDGR